jgi:hypothetical protein
VIATRIAVCYATLQAGQRLIEERDLPHPDTTTVRKVVEDLTLPVSARKAYSEGLLLGRQHVDREAPTLVDASQSLRRLLQAYHHQ